MSVVTKQGFSLRTVALGREPKALAESKPEDPTLPWASFLPSDILLVLSTGQILARSQKRTDCWRLQDCWQRIHTDRSVEKKHNSPPEYKLAVWNVGFGATRLSWKPCSTTVVPWRLSFSLPQFPHLLADHSISI